MYGFVRNQVSYRTDRLGEKECNEDTYFHYQNMSFTIILKTAMDKDLTISDPSTTLRDALGVSLASELKENLAEHAGLNQHVKTIAGHLDKFTNWLVMAEAMSSAAWIIWDIIVSVQADYCCQSCVNNKKHYQWKPAKGKASSPNQLMISMLNVDELSTKLPVALMQTMQKAAEDLLDNACATD